MEMKQWFFVVLICCALAVSLECVAVADDLQPIEKRSPQEVVDGMANKAVRGLANVTTGWLEFPMQIYTTYKEDGTTKGILVGPIKGVGMTLVRTLAGVGEVATFFIPYPGFYDPYFDPSFVWEEE